MISNKIEMINNSLFGSYAIFVSFFRCFLRAPRTPIIFDYDYYLFVRKRAHAPKGQQHNSIARGSFVKHTHSQVKMLPLRHMQSLCFLSNERKMILTRNCFSLLHFPLVLSPFARALAVVSAMEWSRDDFELFLNLIEIHCTRFGSCRHLACSLAAHMKMVCTKTYAEVVIISLRTNQTMKK